MSMVETSRVAALLRVKTGKFPKLTMLDLADAIGRGLHIDALDGICAHLAPGDTGLKYQIVPKATFMRRQQTAGRRLSAEESGRVARLAQLWDLALDVWGAPEAARRFLGTPHPLLRNRVPRDLAIESELGARAVENILCSLKYGTVV
jgi:putative toxin-antitoxin system antitoxin component (TIGR02293 family)